MTIIPYISFFAIVSLSIIPQIIAKTGIKYVVDEPNKAELRLINWLNIIIAIDVHKVPKIIM
tara:strand:- start:29 stop:214 length:186 start_codon:yes stop_codon:yes gene_type:complete